MTNRRAMAVNVGLWIVSLLLAYLFFFQGLSKFPDSSRWARAFAQWHFPVWFRLLIGVLELAAAALLLWPRTAFLGALTVIVVMLGGMATHVWWGHPEQSFHEAMPLVVATIIAIGRRRVFLFPMSRTIAMRS
jgi:putative oxidoreductase